MHTTMLTRLSTFAHNEFEQILRERNVVELLNRLEELLADARRRRGREVDGEKEEDVVPYVDLRIFVSGQSPTKLLIAWGQA